MDIILKESGCFFKPNKLSLGFMHFYETKMKAFDFFFLLALNYKVGLT